mmetsp:Transcript_19545/g.39470  ORF Transcript_19545/g.39470 Transcript_19545/m.39470 type:complete len:80 (+) Transcript_19545:547-786(+)
MRKRRRKAAGGIQQMLKIYYLIQRIRLEMATKERPRVTLNLLLGKNNFNLLNTYQSIISFINSMQVYNKLCFLRSVSSH